MRKTFRINGMHCASCEVLIEEKLKQLPGVEQADVSYGRREATLTLKDESHLSAKDLTRACTEHGYQFSDAEMSLPGPVTPHASPLWQRLGGIILLVLALYLVLDRLGFLTFSPAVENPSSLAAVFVVGLIAAVSSCTAIVGGLLAAVSFRHAERHPDASAAQKFRPHLLFNTGRLLGFALLGALVGWIGQRFEISTTFNGILVVLIGIVMALFGIHLLKIFPRGLPLLAPPKALTRFIHASANSDRPFVPFLLGAVTFFLPCGFTQAMQLYALSLGDPVLSGATMAVFALGTMPALLGIGWISAVARGNTLHRLSQVAGAFVLVLGIANLQNGTALLDIRLPSVNARAEQSRFAPVLVGSEQIIQMEVTPYGIYLPDTLTVVEGVPVRWEISGADSMGCASSLVLRAAGVNAVLRPGWNTVRFTPPKPGQYTFSCSMGMVRGTMVVVPRL